MENILDLNKYILKAKTSFKVDFLRRLLVQIRVGGQRFFDFKKSLVESR